MSKINETTQNSAAPAPSPPLCETYLCGKLAQVRYQSGLGRHKDGWIYKCKRCGSDGMHKNKDADNL